ncbi:MAG: hypothetical protein IPG84_14400 [Betaproteobacteria bacterium]|nr:hypothetical protein [Betaproteobacteria bacterium]
MSSGNAVRIPCRRREMTMSIRLDQQCIDTLRFLSVGMVQKAKSGHPGTAAWRRADGLRAVAALAHGQPALMVSAVRTLHRSNCAPRGTELLRFRDGGRGGATRREPRKF